MATALALAVGFIFLGKVLFQFLGITMSDFLIAGGIILFVIALLDLVSADKARRQPARGMGAVPPGNAAHCRSFL